MHGFLPDYLNNMMHLQNLNLARNNFSGSIPITWGQLCGLKHLVLRRNKLSGSVPDSIANITGLKELDLSSNDLTGRIPDQLYSIPTFNFTGTHLNCGSSLRQPCVSGTSIPGLLLPAVPPSLCKYIQSYMPIFVATYIHACTYAY